MLLGAEPAIGQGPPREVCPDANQLSDPGLRQDHLLVAANKNGEVFIADFLGGEIKKWTPDGKIVRFAGTGALRSAGDGGPAIDATVGPILALAVDAQGNLFIAEGPNSPRIRRVTPSGTIATFAGTGKPGIAENEVAATSTPICPTISMAADGTGNLFAAPFIGSSVDYGPGGDRSIHKISPTGVISRVMAVTKVIDERYWICEEGQGQRATQCRSKAEFDNSETRRTGIEAQTIAADASGNLYIFVKPGNRIKKVAPDGAVTDLTQRELLSNRFTPNTEDGVAATAYVYRVGGMVVDSKGNLLFTQLEPRTNPSIRMVTTEGRIATVAGNGTAPAQVRPTALTSGDSSGSQITVDGAGNVFIAERGPSRRIHRIDRGVISTIYVATNSKPAETWTDPATGLMWTGSDSGQRGAWDVANAYCENLTLGGHSDWRLGTMEEVEGLFDPTALGKVKETIKLTFGVVWSRSTDSGGFRPAVLSFNFIAERRVPGNGSAALCVRKP
jgi:hypothetical protein